MKEPRARPPALPVVICVTYDISVLHAIRRSNNVGPIIPSTIPWHVNNKYRARVFLKRFGSFSTSSAIDMVNACVSSPLHRNTFHITLHEMKRRKNSCIFYQSLWYVGGCMRVPAQENVLLHSLSLDSVRVHSAWTTLNGPPLYPPLINRRVERSAICDTFEGIFLSYSVTLFNCLIKLPGDETIDHTDIVWHLARVI